MKKTITFWIQTVCFFVCITSANLMVDARPAFACPMCRSATANSEESKSRQPQAYFISILFMLAVPATIFTTLGVALVRMNRNEADVVRQLEQQNHPHSSDN